MTEKQEPVALTNKHLVIFWVLCIFMFITSTFLIIFSGIRDSNSFAAVVETEDINHATIETLLRQIRSHNEKTQNEEREFYKAKIESILYDQSRQLSEIKYLLDKNICPPKK